MGWIKDLVEDLLDWFFDSVIEPIVDWLKDAIEEIQVNLRNFLHSAKEVLAEWLENDLFFLWFVAAVITAIFVAPEIAAWLKETGLYKAVSAFTKKVVDGVVKLINLQAYINLKLVDSVLIAFVDEYRKARAGLTDVLSGLAADLGHGTGFLNAVVESSRGIYVGTAAVLGLDPRLAEIQWYNETSAFTKNINDRFYHYARDPSAAYYDFFNDVLLPRSQELMTVQQAELDQVRENYNRMVEIEGGLRLVRVSVDDFIAAMPAAIEEQFNDRWETIEPVIDDLLTTLNDDIIPRFNLALSAIEQAQKMQAQVNAVFMEKMNDINAAYFRWSEFSPDERALASSGLADMITGGEASEATLHDDESARWQARIDALTDQVFGSRLIVPSLSYEARGVSRFVAPKKVNIPSPFVGEY